MKALGIEKIISFIDMLRCGWITARYSLVVSLRARSQKASRRFVTKCLRQASINVLNVLHTDYKAIDLDKIPLTEQTPIIFMSNHLSLFDLPLIMATIKKSIRVVIKKELTHVPFLGKAALASEQIIVDRGNPINRALFYKNAAEKLKSGLYLWVFPEGTRSKHGDLLPFKMGGFQLAQSINAHIIPVGIVGTNTILPAGKLMPKRHQTIEIRIGDMIDTAAFEGETKLLATYTKNAIQLLYK